MAPSSVLNVLSTQHIGTSHFNLTTFATMSNHLGIMVILQMLGSKRDVNNSVYRLNLFLRRRYHENLQIIWHKNSKNPDVRDPP